MPVRSSRTEQLTLVPTAGGAPIPLFTQSREIGDLTTQDIFQVSPDGAYLAYATGTVLHVRSHDGTERTIADYQPSALMRFSPAGEYLAAVVGSKYSRQRLVLFDLATGATRELATFYAVEQLEWQREAVVVHAWDPARKRDVLVEVPLAGEPRILLERGASEIDRFVAAATGTRVVAFVRDPARTRILAIDPHGTHDIGTIGDGVTNAAASLDGDVVAFTAGTRLFTITGDASPRVVADRPFIHSVWIARDGRIGYASQTEAAIVGATGARPFDSDGWVSMLRFDPVSAQALVATSAHVWDIAPATPRAVATAPAGSELLGVDHFAGGLVLWTALGP